MLTIKEKAEKISVIATELSEQLKLFPKEIAMIFYASKTTGAIEVPQHSGPKRSTEENRQHIHKMMKEAELKWTYLSPDQEKQLKEMERLIEESKQKIEALYASGT